MFLFWSRVPDGYRKNDRKRAVVWPWLVLELSTVLALTQLGIRQSDWWRAGIRSTNLHIVVESLVNHTSDGNHILVQCQGTEHAEAETDGWEKWPKFRAKLIFIRFQWWACKPLCKWVLDFNESHFTFTIDLHIDGLMLERCNSMANAVELHLSYTNPSILCMYHKFFYSIFVLMEQGLWSRWK